MEVDQLEIIELELKYCERCGALWLRPYGVEQVYCATCTPRMLNAPMIRKSKGRTRLAVTEDLCRMDMDGQSALLVEGGHA